MGRLSTFPGSPSEVGVDVGEILESTDQLHITKYAVPMRHQRPLTGFCPAEVMCESAASCISRNLIRCGIANLSQLEISRASVRASPAWVHHADPLKYNSIFLAFTSASSQLPYSVVGAQLSFHLAKHTELTIRRVQFLFLSVPHDPTQQSNLSL